MAKIKTQGTQLRVSNETADATAYASATFLQVMGITDISEPDGEAAEIDTTDLNSTASEFMMGLADNGKFTITGHVVVDDPGQEEMLAARDAQELRWIRLTDSAGGVAYFKAVIPRFNIIGAARNGVKPMSGTIRISGAITYV